MLKHNNISLLKSIWESFDQKAKDSIVMQNFYYIDQADERTLDWFANLILTQISEEQKNLLLSVKYPPNGIKKYFQKLAVIKQIQAIKSFNFKQFINLSHDNKLELLQFAIELKEYDFIYRCLYNYLQFDVNEFNDFYFLFFIDLCANSHKPDSLRVAQLTFDLCQDKNMVFRNSSSFVENLKRIAVKDKYYILNSMTKHNILSFISTQSESDKLLAAKNRVIFVKWLWSVIPQEIQHEIFKDNNYKAFDYSSYNYPLMRFWWSICTDEQKEEIVKLMTTQQPGDNTVIPMAFKELCKSNDYRIAKEMWDIAWDLRHEELQDNSEELLTLIMNNDITDDILIYSFNMINFLLAKSPDNAEIIDTLNDHRADNERFLSFEEFNTAQTAIYGEDVSALIWSCYKANYSINETNNIINKYSREIQAAANSELKDSPEVQKIINIADLITICHELDYTLDETCYFIDIYGHQIATLIMELHTEGYNCADVLNLLPKYQYSLASYLKNHPEGINLEQFKELVSNLTKASLTFFVRENQESSPIRNLPNDIRREILKHLNVHPNDLSFQSNRHTITTVQDYRMEIEIQENLKKRKFAEIEEEKQSSNKKQKTSDFKGF
ncbi:MAG: hypothetical protein J0G32_06785 [Alphaproteobacteria bacterium]|mgnify:CR=1 FL=1|nr:hypothetical protein [Alphaproteobacteria bacterium]